MGQQHLETLPHQKKSKLIPYSLTCSQLLNYPLAFSLTFLAKTKFLLENGADPNFVSVFWDETPEETVCMLPLERTCYDKYGMNYMKLLLEHGANPNDTRAQLPLFAAALYEDKQKIEY